MENRTLGYGMRERVVNRIVYRMLAVVLVVLVALAAAPHAWAAPVGKDVVDQDLVVVQGETLQGDVNVTNGNLTVYGTIDGKATIVNGGASIYGTVNGDLTVVTGGNITLYAGSYVDGNVVDMGGKWSGTAPLQLLAMWAGWRIPSKGSAICSTPTRTRLETRAPGPIGLTPSTAWEAGFSWAASAQCCWCFPLGLPHWYRAG